MKIKTENLYQKSIERVVNHLNEEINNSPSLATLAEVAAISPYHFHRIYRAMTGETPLMTVRRLRLAKACAMLGKLDLSITAIAFEVGYDTSQNFARAFKAATGATPSEVRNSKEALDKAIALLTAPGKTRIAEAANIEVHVQSIDPLKVITSRHNGHQESLVNAYRTFFDFAEQQGWMETFKGIYGIPVDDPRYCIDDQCRFDCCIDFGPKVKPIHPYQSEMLGGGKYAVLRHTGHYDLLDQKYDYLYTSWLSSSGYQLRDAPCFNHYLKDPETVPSGQWETNIHLPVQ